MWRERLLGLGLAAALAATGAATGAVADTGGPYLVIEVAGEASGEVVIDLRDDLAPLHAERLVTLAEAGAYDGVVFHRVIDGFMAQTGDVQFGVHGGDTLEMAGMGGSDLPNLPAEFTDAPFDRGVLGMARGPDEDSANSQFFITFAPAPHLNGQYTVVGQVVSGMEVVDAIKRGDARRNGVVDDPDRMARVTVRR